MKITKIVFSPTGGTMRIVESLFDGQFNYIIRQYDVEVRFYDLSGCNCCGSGA